MAPALPSLTSVGSYYVKRHSKNGSSRRGMAGLDSLCSYSVGPRDCLIARASGKFPANSHQAKSVPYSNKKYRFRFALPTN
jgi:hypothetical protein